MEQTNVYVADNQRFYAHLYIMCGLLIAVVLSLQCLEPQACLKNNTKYVALDGDPYKNYERMFEHNFMERFEAQNTGTWHSWLFWS